MSRVSVLQSLTPTDSRGFLDLSEFAVPQARPQQAGVVPTGMTEPAPQDEIDRIVSARREMASGRTGVRPDPRDLSAIAGGVQGSAANVGLGIADALGSLGAGMAGGVNRILSGATRGMIDLSNPGGEIDTTRANELLGSGDPAIRAAGQRLLDQARTVDESARQGFAYENRRQRETATPGAAADSWSYYGGQTAGQVLPSAAAMTGGAGSAAVLGMYAMTGYESAYDRYVETSIKQSGTFDPATAQAVGVVAGATEALSEYLPIPFLKSAGKKAAAAAVDAAMQGGKGWRLRVAREVAKMMGLGAATEGGEEGASEFVNTILELTYDKGLQRQWVEDPQTAAADAVSRIAKSFAQGAIGGLALGGVGMAAGGMEGLGMTEQERQIQAVRQQMEDQYGDPTDQNQATTPITAQDESIRAQAESMRGQPQATESPAGASGAEAAPESSGSPSADVMPTEKPTPKPKGPGVVPPPATAYRERLSDFADRVYRETSIDGAMGFIPEGNRSEDLAKVYLSHTPNLAAGQGKNTGVVLEFDTNGLEGQVDRSKPGWEAAWQAGEAEYVDSLPKQSAYKKSLRSVTIKPDAKADKVSKARMAGVVKAMERNGWTKEIQADGAVKYTRPERADSLADLKSSGVWPKSSDPAAVAEELSASPELAPVADAIRSRESLSRADAAALFGKGGPQTAADRTAWLSSFKAKPSNRKGSLFPGGAGGMTSTPAVPASKPAKGPTVEFRDDWRTNFRQRVQDEFVKVEKLIRDVSGDIAAYAKGNVISTLRRARSLVSYQGNEFDRKFVRPFLQEMKDNQITASEMGMYLVARHAEEANAHSPSTHPDYGYGMDNAEADRIITTMEAGPNGPVLKRLADRYDGYIRLRLSHMHRAGLMSDEEYARLRGYKHYVAVKDVADSLEFGGIEDEGISPGSRKRYSVGRRQFNRRTGRVQGSLKEGGDERAQLIFENIIPHFIADTHSRMNRVMQNVVGNELRRYLQANPSAEGAMKVIGEPPNVAKVVNGVTEFVPDATFKDRPNILYFKMDEDRNVGGKPLKRGDTFFVKVNDPVTAQSLKIASVAEDMGVNLIRKAFRLALRVMKAGTIGLNFTFHTLSNPTKDIVGARVNMGSHPGVEQRTRRQYKKNVRDAFSAVFRAEATGGKARNRQMAAYWEEMQKFGGRIDFIGPKDVDSAAKSVQEFLAPTVGDRVKMPFKKFNDAVRAMQAPFENASRLAYYAALREDGHSPEESAALSRDVTIDFERRGAATGPLRDAFLFMNPQIQGAEKYVRAFTNPTGRKAMMILTMAGFATALAEHFISGGDDEDKTDVNKDGVPDWQENMPYKKRQSIIIPTGGTGRTTIPITWELVAAHTLGLMLGELVTGRTTTKEALTQVAKANIDVFNPFGGSNAFESPHGAIRSFAPSPIQPFVDLAFNRDYRERAIYREPFSQKAEATFVRSQNPMERTPEWQASLAQGINSMTGGDRENPGWFDFPPEVIPYFVNTIFGGSARDIEGIYNLASGEGTVRDVPGLRAVFNTGADPTVLSKRFDDRSAELQRWNKRMLRLAEESPDQFMAEMEQSGDNAEDFGRFDAAEKHLKSIYADLSDLRAGMKSETDPETIALYKAAIKDRQEQAVAWKAYAVRKPEPAPAPR